MMAIFQGQVNEFASLWQLPEDVLRVSEWYEYKNSIKWVPGMQFTRDKQV